MYIIVAANVLKFSESRGIEFIGQKVKVECAKRQPEPSYEADQLNIKAIPDEVDSFYLEIFLDSVLDDMTYSVGGITDNSVIVKFEKDLSTSGELAVR